MSLARRGGGLRPDPVRGAGSQALIRRFNVIECVRRAATSRTRWAPASVGCPLPASLGLQAQAERLAGAGY